MRIVPKSELARRAKLSMLFGVRAKRMLGVQFGLAYEGVGGLYVAVRFKPTFSSRETHDVLKLEDFEMRTVCTDNGALDMARTQLIAMTLARGGGPTEDFVRGLPPRKKEDSSSC